ncbi:hypothetical protein L596_026438 [Steinernema carpocapsae]|uniref:Uncharacterized protein n=1 Tax=Steinernema carpocapsae TaxID=34508 RepID=A0A4U5M1D3_STECR|nr:hypothetical protein L596_026438 [Steinernema carpocapsae]
MRRVVFAPTMHDYSQPSTLPRVHKPNRSRNVVESPSTSAMNEGYLEVAPREQKAKFSKKRTRTRSEMRPSSVSFPEEFPNHDAPPPPLTPRTTSAGELNHLSTTLPRIAEISEVATSPVISNLDYFISAVSHKPATLTESRTLPAGLLSQVSAPSKPKPTHLRNGSYQNPPELTRSDILHYADVPPSGVNGFRRRDPVTDQWFLEQPIELHQDPDVPGPSRRFHLRTQSNQSAMGSSARVSFSVPSTPQKGTMEADPLLVTDLAQTPDAEVQIQLPQRNTSFHRPTFCHRLKHAALVDFFVLADCIDYSVLAAILLLISVEVYLVMLFINLDS